MHTLFFITYYITITTFRMEFCLTEYTYNPGQNCQKLLKKIIKIMEKIYPADFPGVLPLSPHSML